MSQSTHVICVTTEKCCMGNNTDVIQLICPSTGSTLSNNLLRMGSTGIGIQSLIPIPNTQAYLVYSGRKESQDMHAMLLIQGSSSPIWKCRLPELMECFISSPCGLYIIAGGKSGRCYCWSTFHQGELIKIWTAHYRTIHKLCFSNCGKYVVTGGADGIVHAWSLMDIVSSDPTCTLSADNSTITGKSLNPIRTWSQHHLPITALHTMPSSRILSGSSDRQVMILEIFSGQILARMELPTAISSITTDTIGHRVYIGGMNGRIYLIDLDTYAIASTAESATIIQTRISNPSVNEEVKGLNQGKESSSPSSYICELHGHEKAVTLLAVLEGTANAAFDLEDLLISGGIDGSIRIWDIRARCCVRILRPWAPTATANLNTNTPEEKVNTSPCTSITIIPRSDLEIHAHRNTISSSSKRKNNNMIEASILPLQRFTRDHQQQNQQKDTLEDACITIPIKLTRTCVPMIVFDPYLVSRSYSLKHRPLVANVESQTTSTVDLAVRNEQEVVSSSIGESNYEKEINETTTAEIDRLKKELQEARETIDRWQKVNSKLAQRLKKSSS